jgi:hypothetical protein
MDWDLAEHQIPDSQFGFCPTRNTNQPLFILRHILAPAKKENIKVYTAFLDLFAAYDSVPREKLCRRLQKTELIHGLTRFCMRSKIYLHLNSFWMPYDFVRLSI